MRRNESNVVRVALLSSKADLHIYIRPSFSRKNTSSIVLLNVVQPFRPERLWMLLIKCGSPRSCIGSEKNKMT